MAAASWGKYPRLPQQRRECAWRSELPGVLGGLSGGTALPYGNGRSYGDVCLADSGQLIGLTGLDRWVQADWSTGVIEVESGMQLKEVLRQAIPRGWFLPVVPGTQQVTLGGAVANDVHGKNHHLRGTFGRHVTGLTLERSDRGELACSPGSNPELFAATIGGLGLTGIITTVSLRLVPISGSLMETEERRFASLGEFIQLSQTLDQSYEYTAAWLDCRSRQGRGVLSAGRHCDGGEMRGDTRATLSVPVTPPFSLMNPVTLGLMNRLWYAGHRDRPLRRGSYRPFLFPLDGVANWNRVYGRRGFQQYQCVLPDPEGEPALQEILRQIAASGSGSFLSVLKRCGDLASPGLLSFPLPGTSLALDFPQSPRLTDLFARLDDIVAAAGGRLYPAKDAHMSAQHFQRAYPAWEQLESLRDPALLSRFWSRVTATGGSAA